MFKIYDPSTGNVQNICHSGYGNFFAEKSWFGIFVGLIRNWAVASFSSPHLTTKPSFSNYRHLPSTILTPKLLERPDPVIKSVKFSPTDFLAADHSDMSSGQVPRIANRVPPPPPLKRQR